MSGCAYGQRPIGIDGSMLPGLLCRAQVVQRWQGCQWKGWSSKGKSEAVPIVDNRVGTIGQGWGWGWGTRNYWAGLRLPLELPRPADRGPRQIPTAPRPELSCTILTSIYLEIIGCPCVKKCTKFLVLLMFCQPRPADPTKADTHGTSTRAGLHNFKLNIWHIFAKNCKCKVFTVILGLPAWMYQIHHAPYLCLAKSVPWSSFQQMKAGCSESKVLTFCEIW